MQLIGKHHVGALEIKMENGLRRQGMQEIHAERDLSCQRIKGHMLESNFKIINMLLNRRLEHTRMLMYEYTYIEYNINGVHSYGSVAWIECRYW